jgi:hypothetical protein
MSIVRLSGCFECELKVNNDSAEDVQVQDAKDAVKYILPYQLDGQDFIDSKINNTTEPTCEKMDYY